jgi:hypothetical protein
VFAIERPTDLEAAETLAKAIASATGRENRGGLPERLTAVKRLGFLHGTRCRALLAELCSMNTDDAIFAKRPDAPERFAAGLAAGCLELIDPSPHA